MLGASPFSNSAFFPVISYQKPWVKQRPEPVRETMTIVVVNALTRSILPDDHFSVD